MPPEVPIVSIVAIFIIVAIIDAILLQTLLKFLADAQLSIKAILCILILCVPSGNIIVKFLDLPRYIGYPLSIALGILLSFAAVVTHIEEYAKIDMKQSLIISAILMVMHWSCCIVFGFLYGMTLAASQ